jgi:hypothetical protein
MVRRVPEEPPLAEVSNTVRLAYVSVSLYWSRFDGSIYKNHILLGTVRNIMARLHRREAFQKYAPVVSDPFARYDDLFEKNPDLCLDLSHYELLLALSKVMK